MGGDNFDGKYLSKVKFPDGKILLFFCDPEYIAKKISSTTKEEAVFVESGRNQQTFNYYQSTH